MFTSLRTLATESTAQRASKQAIGSAIKWRNSRAPIEPPCRDSNIETVTRPNTRTFSVVSPRCTSTLSITTWENSGDTNANNC